jgi:hypothetical protein
MRISTVREFRDRATALLKSDDPILVTRRGRLAGIFLPWKENTLPIDLKRELYSMLSAEISRQLKKKRIAEREILQGFEKWRKAKRAPRRRR